MNDDPEDPGEAKPASAVPAASRPRRPRRREYYSIGEVCDMLDLKPHVLRYWETQFDGLSPAKNRSGNRVYRAADLETIALIQRLVHSERYTIEGARQRLQEMRDEGAARGDAKPGLQQSYLQSLRSELERLLDLLDPAPR